jgi:hypothetical protein
MEETQTSQYALPVSWKADRGSIRVIRQKIEEKE